MTGHGEPFVSSAPEVKSVGISAGYSIWGITLGPGTGKVWSEMILGEVSSPDVNEISLEH
jgi:glycine/D-amino acid oxidase-like deaminating enzyme